MKKNPTLAGHLACAAAYTIFGLNIVLCKDITNSAVIPPNALFTFRAAGASALFWLLSLFLPKEKVERSDLPKIALASFLGLFLTQMSFLYALKVTTSIDISIISVVTPVFTMIFAAIFLKEPVSVAKSLGVTISMCGVLMLIFNSETHGNGVDVTKPVGIVLMIVNTMSFAAYLGIFRPLIAKYNVVTFMKWMFLVSFVISLPLSAKEIAGMDYGAVSGTVWTEVAYVVVFATFVAYFLIPFGQKRIRPTLVSMYTYLQPLIAAVISIFAGLDTLTWAKVFAAALVVCGVTLVNGSRMK